MRRDSLWFHAGFRWLWAGDTVGQFGTFIGKTALPLLVATVLAATPFQMGMLTAAEDLAFLLIGLPAGVWIDRMRRRPLMLSADFGRAVALLSVPIAWWAGRLTLIQLLVVALLLSVGTVFFDVAYQSYLPSLIGREQLVEGNAKLQTSQSAGQIAGPSIGGSLTQLIGAANTVLTTAVGYLVSALFLWRIKTPEPAPAAPDGTSLRAQIAEGLRFVFGDVTLRAITVCNVLSNLASGAFIAVEVLFLARDLRLSPGAVGFMLTCEGIGGLLGALSAGWWTGRIGQARTTWLVCVVTWPSSLLIPLARPGELVALTPIGLVFFSYGVIVYNVAQVSYRQAICPDRLLGRMNASVRFMIWGIAPVGSLAGGALGELIGVRGTVWVSLAVQTLAITPLLLSPLRKMRDVPAMPVGATDTTPRT